MSDGEVGFSKLTGPMQVGVLFLGALGVIVPAVLGFVNLDKRQDILENAQTTHVAKDEHKWGTVDTQIDSLQSDVHALELIDKELLIHYNEIIRRLDKADSADEKMLGILQGFEVMQ